MLMLTGPVPTSGAACSPIFHTSRRESSPRLIRCSPSTSRAMMLPLWPAYSPVLQPAVLIESRAPLYLARCPELM